MNLDYSALSQPVTPADIAAYKQWRGGHKTSKALQVAMAVFGLFIAAYILGNIGLSLAASGRDALGPSSFIILGIIITAVAIVIYNRVTTKKRAKLYKFAVANKITLFFDTYTRSHVGMIFDEGHSNIMLAAMQFPDNTEIGNYQYTTGSGKSRQTHNWGYAVVKLTRKLPHMVLDAKHNNAFGFSNLPDTFRGQTLSLEGDFNKHFTLYAPTEYGRDALYVFTPDVMAALIDSGSTYDIEIVDDNLYLYRKGQFTLDSEAELSSLLAIINKLGTEIRDQSHRYSDERVAESNANMIAEPGRRLKTGVSIGSIIAVIALLIYAGLYVMTWFPHN